MDNMDVDNEEPRGIKRKAEDPDPFRAPKRIKALAQDVVNKIAAGEIIVAPVHALKELIENAVDAGSTSIEVLVKDGGLKLLQITDNGSGINKDDMPILCERFTTSKLKTFEDLTAIGTYGFRGEALASISHIAHLTITTKTADSSCAWRAHYSDGKLVPAKPGQSADPKPTAGRGGTQITVEDLFYNVPSRQRAFRSPSEEYAKILDVVGRYAVHCSGVAFSCKKHGDSAMGISTSVAATTADCIRQIHGSAIANELIEFDVNNDKWGFKASGYTTNANYHVKRMSLLLFINHRSVESSLIKKSIEQTYSMFLPKGGHPFTYLSLEIDPARVDVNVHPTKREVNFLNEDEIVDEICTTIRIRLSEVDTSRTFLTQTLLPGTAIAPSKLNATTSAISSTPIRSRSTQQQAFKPPSLTPQSSSKPLENALVRTDPSVRKITSMLPSLNRNASSIATPSSEAEYTISPRPPTICRLTTIKELRATVRDDIHARLTETIASLTYVGLVDSQKRIVAIQSGVKLYLMDYGLLTQEFFYQLGLTDFGNFGEIRFDPPLSIKDLIATAVEEELHAARATNDNQQKTETRKSKHGSVNGKGPGGPIEDDDIDWSLVPLKITNQLISRREMLAEYFSVHISPEGLLLSIPLLLKHYNPSFLKLPRFLARLGPCVKWNEEKACFDGFLRELSRFYAVERLPMEWPGDVSSSAKEINGDAGANTGRGGGFGDMADGNGIKEKDHQPPAEREASEMQIDDSHRDQANGTEHDKDEEEDREDKAALHSLQTRKQQVEHALEHVLFPAMRARLIATRGMLDGVLEVADLKGLYRVFERC